MLNYWRKKHNKQSKKHSYKQRKQVSEKRLRIGGRFVTKQRAFEILGITQSDLLACPYMQELLNKEGTQGKLLKSSIKNDKRAGLTHHVYNFQALIDNTYSVMSEAQPRTNEKSSQK